MRTITLSNEDVAALGEAIGGLWITAEMKAAAWERRYGRFRRTDRRIIREEEARAATLRRIYFRVTGLELPGFDGARCLGPARTIGVKTYPPMWTPSRAAAYRDELLQQVREALRGAEGAS